MQQPVETLSQRERYKPGMFTRFLWWLSTAEEEIIIDCAVDRNRYAITGIAVLGTWVFATLVWAYFFSTVINSTVTAILLGIFMGGIILSIDRALIKGINSTNKRKIVPLAFRGLLALTIGTFMAQPALLYLFDKEIHVQISLDNEQRKMAKQHEQDSLFAASKTELLNQKAQLQNELSTKYNEVSAARDAFIAETDGTGGSHKIGLKKIAQTKQAAYQKLDADYQQLTQQLQPKLDDIDKSLASIDAQKQAGQQAFMLLLNDGFLTRSEALHHLIQNNGYAAFRFYLLVIILVLIELMPVIAKTLLPNGTYDEKVRLREEMEKTIAQSNIKKEEALKELYNQTAFEQDSNFIQAFFEEAKEQRKQKMKRQFDEWSKNEKPGFDGFWEKVKRDMLTKQEN
ncbi:MAG TPA: DUF4407 domain-containing protein [Chitinophagaceae bacterium]|nr:DUF4407 domain-containing protein [Chitinophagaceae bacterium]